MTTAYHLPAGKALGDSYVVDVNPEKAGWGYSSLRVLELPPGRLAHAFQRRQRVDRAVRSAVPARSRRRTTSATPPSSYRAATACSAASATSCTCPATPVRPITSAAGGRFALTGARCTRRLPARYGPASSVPVELRGTGNSSRQVNNFGAAGVFECDKLIAVEVITPGGNWSSFPPHKHDEHRPGEESVLEEIYYFEFAATTARPASATSGSPRPGRGGTRMCWPRCGPGTSSSSPTAGTGPPWPCRATTCTTSTSWRAPSADRAWLICDHPDHAWVRGTWPEQPVDPRLPLYTAPEKS